MTRTGAAVERTSDGRRLVVTRELDAPADDAWDVLVETRTWPEWGPSVTAVRGPDRISAGVTGEVQIAGLGLWVPFEVTTFDADARRWTWTVARVPATGHRVEALGDCRCRVGFEIPLLASGYAPVCKRALSKIDRLVAR
ncbi:polyketide cyclase/dehydrase [Halogeometricum borinquense DSM 11551]|uniref:Polyketide cyclase / dehydrase and lipid transport n=2 Tax=Halogeometricum borinquense TaxID=60847 RepID=E4NMX6_HALBP|nr:SRPBCC family protein [Halogeometricum borinquense]ADQ67388.1 Polyketide cyclase / dehydrase and lipid transport [Halogeometricum borinquense DSM 11551]ELY28600.1 polyketide cyclase/dehydrase [Halogeometricum borinquense DSM 11551]RYJ13610.1 SRPBCC family protein [Halogeometricum borinquense]